MRHGKKIIKLGRKSAHRKAMLANMALSLIEHKRITTTSTKAKALKIFIEPRPIFWGSLVTVWAVSSAVEHYVDIVGVTGSIPVPPTMNSLPQY
jgi:ribosomal protein L17